MKKYFCVLFILCICFVFSSCRGGESVNSADEAIKIAQDYVFEKYENNFDDYEISTDLKDGVWTVYYSLKSDNADIYILGGGGPQLEINQSNGKVTSCFLQE